MALQIENRGTDAVPFGFVYVSDNVRVGYSMTDGEDGVVTVWGDAGPYWTEPTDDDAAAALAALVEAFPAITRFKNIDEVDDKS